MYGAGACCVVVAQRSLISSRCRINASFATGLYVAMACFAKEDTATEDTFLSQQTTFVLLWQEARLLLGQDT